MANKPIAFSLTVLALGAGVLISATNAFAGATVATLSGKCTSFVAMGISADPALCKNQVMNIEMPNGRNGFAFFLNKPNGESAMVTFFGDGNKQVHKDKDHAIQPIDRVRFKFQESTDDLKAVGTCSFANPYMRKPVTTECRATTSKGDFSGKFTSDGVSPNLSEM